MNMMDDLLRNEETEEAEEAAQDARRLQRLNRMKSLAAGFLVAALLLYAIAQFLLARHPAWAYVSAFAEAAMIGAIADWFAVVAMFRHPLGLPIWHTAIIPRNKAEIAKNLGQFIVTHFVTVEGIVGRVRDYDPAGKFAGWLVQPSSAQRLGKILREAALTLLHALDDSRMRSMVRDNVLQRLQRLDISSAAGDLLDSLVEEKRHQELFDFLLRLLREKLAVEENQAKVADFLGDALDLNNNRIFGSTMRSILDSMTPRMLDTFNKKTLEVLENPEHAWRQQVDLYAVDLIMHLKLDAQWHEKISQVKTSLLANTQFTHYLEGLWDETKERMLAELLRQDGAWPRQLDALALQFGSKLAADAALQDWFNGLILEEVAPLVQQHRSAIASFITREIDAWSKDQMTHRVELAIGRDLQFIRINGTLVGGLVGLLIYSLTHWLKV